MAATQLFVNIKATSLGSGLVRSVTDMTPVSFPQLVIGDGRNYELYFVDGTGAYADWSGNGAYTPFIAIGQCAYPTGGTFTLTFGANTTAALAYNASMAAIQTALQGLASIGSGNCLVAGVPGEYFTVTFVGDLANTNVSEIVSNFSLLTPTSTIDVSTIVVGGGGFNEVQLLTLAQNPITFADDWTPITNGWTGQLSSRTLEIIQAFAVAGGSITDTFQITVADTLGVRTTYVKQDATIVCTIINPESFAGADKPLLATQAALNAAVLGLNNFTYEALASAAAGNTNITPTATSRHHTAIATITGTAGTRTFSILTSNSPNSGDTVLLKFITPATAGIVLEVHNATSGGTLLSTVTTTADQEPFFLVFVFNGTSWVLEFDQGAVLAKIGNLAGLASPRLSRLSLKTLFSKVSSKSADFTVGSTEDGYLFEVSAAAGAVVGTLPSAVTAGEGFCIAVQKSDSSPNVVTTSPTTATIPFASGCLILVSDGTNWILVMQYNPDFAAVTVGQVIQNQSSLTGLVGGGSLNLDGLSTANGATPAYAAVMLSYGTSAQIWQLVPGVDAAAWNIVRPVDFDATSNPQVWKLLLDFAAYQSDVTGIPITLTTMVASDILTLSLPAGTWDITGTVTFVGTGMTTTQQDSSLGLTSATLDTTDGQFVETPFSTTTLSTKITHVLPTVRMVLTAPDVVYLVAQGVFSAGGIDVSGNIRATRVR